MVEDIKTAIGRLSDDERRRLRDWLDELESQRFDERIERDATAGKLDEHMAKAQANAKAGNRRTL